MHPDYDYAHFSIGLALLGLNRLDEASREIARSGPTAAGISNGYWGLGEVLVKQQQFAEAETRYREGLEREPLHYWCRFGLANLMLTQERTAEAERSLRQLVQLDPKMVFGHSYLGHALQAQEKFPEAEQACLEAIRSTRATGKPTSCWRSFVGSKGRQPLRRPNCGHPRRKRPSTTTSSFSAACS